MPASIVREVLEVVSVSATSSRGGDPDATANAMLKRFGFEPAPDTQPHRMYAKAVPDPQFGNSHRLYLSGDSRRTEGRLAVKVDSVREAEIDSGRVIDQGRDPTKGSTHRMFAVEGRHLQWVILCRSDDAEARSAPVVRLVSSAPLRPYASPAAMPSPAPRPSLPAPPKTNGSVARHEVQGANRRPSRVLAQPPVVDAPSIPASPVSQGLIPVRPDLPDLRSVPAASDTAPLPEVRRIPVADILPFKGQPRKKFRAHALRALGENLLAEGQKVFIEVSPAEDDPSKFELISGERRWRAAQLVGVKTLDAIVRSRDEVPDHRVRHRRCLVTDLYREGYSKHEVSLALLEEYEAGTSVAELKKIYGKSDAWIYQHLALKDLVPALRALLDPDLPRSQQISFSIAYRLARVPKERQEELYAKIRVAKGSRLQLIEAKKLIAEAVPTIHPGRKRVPSDYVESLGVVVPRMTADALSANGYPAATFTSLIQCKSAEDVSMMLQHLEQVREGATQLAAKIRAAQSAIRK